MRSLGVESEVAGTYGGASMSEVKHTPTPWKVGWDKGLTGPNMSTMATFDFDGRKVIPIAGPNQTFVAAVPQLQDANAEHIVRCVNSHEELVEALKAAVQGCGCTIRERESGHLVDCFAPCAIEALAKAGRP